MCFPSRSDIFFSDGAIGMGVTTQDWLPRLLQISDSGFPTGAFGHSQGLEYAIQRQWIKSGADLLEWAREAIEHAIVPLDSRACLKSWKIEPNADATEWLRLNEAVSTLRPSFAQRRGSSETGQALWKNAVDCFGIDRSIGASMNKPQYSVAWGRICRLLDVPLSETAMALVLGYVRGWAQVALRIIPLGQKASYRFLAQTSDYLAGYDWERQSDLELESLSPGWEIAQLGHQNLRIRSFRS